MLHVVYHTMRQLSDKLATVKELKVPILLSLSVLSDLQQKILFHICTTPNASYETLGKMTNRDRVTIFQSLESLIKYRYIEKYKVNPELDKSKLIFVPTHKAMAFAWRYLKVNVSDLISIKDDEITSYLKFSLKSKDPQIRNRMITTLLSKLERGALEFHNTEHTRQDLVRDCFYEDLFVVLRQSNYDGKFFASLKEIFPSKQLEDFRKTLFVLRDNINSAIRDFSDSGLSY